MHKKLPIVAIVGRPNVGKSSLFNRLVGQRHAVVSQEAGTTRDPVQNALTWNGHSFWLIDTAGLKTAADELEEGIQGQIEEAKQAADAIVVVIEAGVLSDEDIKTAKLALKTKKPVVLAVNKIDTAGNKLPESAKKLGIKTIVGVSAIHGTRSGDLLDAITEVIPHKRPLAEDPSHTLALLGRPNVGKSSLFNALIGQQQALVAPAAGTTRDVNRAQLKYHGQDYQLLDTAGWRKAAKTTAIEHFSILRTLQSINEADVAIVVLDALEPATKLDQKIAGLVKEAGKGLIIAINKWDALKDEPEAQKLLEQRLRVEFAFAWWATPVLISAQEGHNVRKLLELAQTIIKNRSQQLRTPLLNRLLADSLAHHPPAGLKNRHPKLKYITQTGINPPEISLFGSQLDFLHWSYKRYLENELRKAFDLSGTPIRFNLREKLDRKSTIQS